MMTGRGLAGSAPRMAQAGPGNADLAGMRRDAGVSVRPAPARVRLIAAPQGQAGGGMGRVTAYLMQEQARRGDLAPMEALESRGPGAATLSAFAVARAAARVAGLALRGRASVLHLNVAERGSVVRKGVLLGVARLFGVPVVLHLHAAQIVAFHAALPRPARALVGLVFRSAQMVVVLGEPWRRWVASLGVPEARIRVLRNGVPRLSGWRAREAGAPFRLVFLGNLFGRKGIADLLAAVALLGPQDAPCTLVVAGGGDVAGHEALAEGLGIGGRVWFEGWVDQAGAAACLAEADALVLPSYDEGLPLVILEALSLGVPVVCTPVGAIPEVLADGDTALLVPPGDVAALAGALRRIAGDPALAAGLSERGRALYEREFTLPVFAERVAALHAEVGL